MTNDKKLSIGLLIALVGFPQISETIYTPALPAVAIGLSASESMVEATLAIYFMGFALGVLLWGMISDRWGRRPAMLMGLFVYGIGTLACGNSGSVEALLAWRFLQAFGASVGSVVTQTILRDAYDGAQRTKLFSVMSAALAFSPAIGPVLGGVISEFLGWRANFWFLAVLAVVLAIWSFFCLSETRPAHIVKISSKEVYKLFREMIGAKALWGHILLIGATNGILFGFYQEAPFVFIEQLGMNPSIYGLFGILIAAATVFAARISYRQSAKSSAKTIIRFGVGCVVGGSIILMLAALLGIFNLSTVGMIVVMTSLFLIFFGVGLIIPNSLSHALKPYQRAAGTAGSLFGGSYYCLIAAFMMMMSFFHNGTVFPMPFYMMLMAIVLAVGSSYIPEE